MTNIEISKLTGDWKIWAQQADSESDDNKIKNDGFINSAFEEDRVKTMAKNAGKTDDEINAIFGADFSQTKTNTPEKVQKDMTLASAPNTIPDKNIKEIVEASALKNLTSNFSDNVVMADNEGIAWNDLVEVFAEQANSLINENKVVDANYYKSLIKPMQDVANAMSSKTFNSRNDVIKLYKEVKNSLNISKNDPYKEFKLNVLKQFIVIAENFQKQKELAQIGNEYRELRKTNTREQAMDKIQNSPKFKGSYYHDYYHDGVETVGLTDKDSLTKRKGLIHQFEDSVVMDEARNEAWNAMNKQQGKLNLTSYRKIKKAAKKELGINHDKYTRKVFRGELSTADKLKFETSNTKAKGQSIATENRVATQTTKEFSLKELTNTLKDNSNVQSLLQGGLITKNNNNTYNIKPLAEKIRTKVGADLVANKQRKDLYPYSEVANIVNQIAADSGAQLSEKEVKKLIKLCGFKVEGKNWVKIAIDSAVETFAPAVGMAGGVLLSSAKVKGTGIQDVTLPYTAKVNLETLINQNVDVNLNLKLPDGVSIDGRQLYKDLINQGINPNNIKITYDNGKVVGVSFNISDSIKSDVTELNVHGKTSDKVPVEVKADRKLLNVLLRQVGLAYGLNFLKNAFQDNQGELPVVVTQFATKDLNEYKKLINAQQNLTNSQKEALKNFAEQFKQNNTWNAEAFKSALNEIAGDSSMLNKHEFAIGIDKLSKDSEKVAKLVQENNSSAEKTKDNNKAENVNKTNNEITSEEKTKTEAKEEFSNKPIEANYHMANKHTWDGILALYEDCKKQNPNISNIDIVHAIKDINGIKYSDNVIPKHLYLPEILLPENNGKIKTFDDSNAREKFIYSHDKKVKRATTVKSNGTKLGTIRTSDGYRGIKSWYASDGKTVILQKQTAKTYPNKQTAINEAEKLKKDK